MPVRSADVLVIGAGPAGSAAAIALLQLGRSVIVVDRGAVAPRPGEGLPGAARCELAALGLWDDFLAQRHNAVWSMSSAWGSAALVSQDLSFHPYGQNWHLDREAFDGLCRSRAAARGAVLLEGTVAHAYFADGAWVATVAAGEHAALTVRFVIDATGRASAFARGQGMARRKRERLVGLAATFPDRLAPGGVLSTTVEARPDGWWYAARLPRGLTTAVYMTDADGLPSGRGRLAQFWQQQLSMTSHIKEIASPPDAVEVQAWPAESAALERPHGDRWLAVGDAACSFDPLSSLGLKHALESATWAAAAVDDALRGSIDACRPYGRRIAGRIRDFERMKHAYYAAEPRWRLHRFWARRHAVSAPPAREGRARS